MPQRTKRPRKKPVATSRPQRHPLGDHAFVADSSSPGDESEPQPAIPRHEPILVASILTVAALLRLTIAVLNDVANDNHLQVVHILLDGKTRLQMGDCHECFQPKLFYWGFASLFRLFHIATSFWQLRVGQILNATFGIITSLIVYRFLLRQRFSSGVRILVMALAALNPAFLAINGQFTNDSLVVLFSAGGILAFAKFSERQQLRHFWVAAACLTLAFATKATSWVCGLALVLSLVAGALAFQREGLPRPGRNFILAGILVLMLFSAIKAADYDFNNYGVYAGLGKNSEIHFFEKTYVGRPGVVSIYDSFLTFRFADLFRYPYTNNGLTLFPLHRSSLFSQLYGRLHFLHLDFWPPAWQLHKEAHFHVGRFNLVFGLLPTGLFLVGLYLSIRGQWRALTKNGLVRWVRRQEQPNLVCLLLCLGYLAFIVRFNWDFRDFAGMKPIYLLPGMLGFVKILADGYQWAMNRLERARRLRIALVVLSMLLLAGYTTDVLVLVGQLLDRFGAATSAAGLH